jgi:hypothetical protein
MTGPGVHYHDDDPGAACYADDAPGLAGIPDPCFCDGPWSDIEPADRPETRIEREHVRGSIVNDKARCLYADLPPGATVEPWTDADTDELAEAMSHAANVRRDRWMVARAAGDATRREAIRGARLTDDELATAAARFGIVADGDALPLNALRASPHHRTCRRNEAIDRQRELGDVWAGVIAARGTHQTDGIPGGGKTTHTARYYEDSDGFDEREAIRSGAALRWPIYSTGMAAAHAHPKPPRDPRANTYRRPPEAHSAPLDLDR